MNDNEYTDQQYRDFAQWVTDQLTETCKALPYKVNVSVFIGSFETVYRSWDILITGRISLVFDGTNKVVIPMTHMFQNDEWEHIKPLFENGTIKNIYVGTEALKLIDSLRADISVDPAEQTC